MYLHANAKLGLSGRYALVCAIEGGLSLKAAAHRWWHRWLEGGPAPVITCRWRSPGAALVMHG